VSKVQIPTNWHLRTNQIQRAYLPPTRLFIIKRLLDTPNLFIYFFFYHDRTAPVGQGILIVKASRSHSDTHHSVGLVWKSDQPDAETSTWQHTTLTTDKHPRLKQDNPSKWAPVEPRITPRGHWDRPNVINP